MVRSERARALANLSWRKEVEILLNPSVTFAMVPPVKADQVVAVSAEKIDVPEIEKLLERDGYLKLHEREIRRR